MPRDPRYTTQAASAKLMISAISAVFVGYNPQFSAPWRILVPCDTRYTTLASGIGKTRDFGHFWPFSWVTTHSFQVPGGFRWPINPIHDSSDIGKTRDFGHF